MFSIIVLVWGVCLAGKDFIKSERQNQKPLYLNQNEYVHQKLPW